MAVVHVFSFENVVAADYEALRPDYAPEAIAWVIQRAGLGPGSLVVDLAAGTGQLSRRLAPLGVDILAVEPARNMRSIIEARLPAVRTSGASAEALPLDNGEADAVVVGNAFHHFNEQKAFAEIRRVLRTGGALALFWSGTADSVYSSFPTLREIEDAVERTCASDSKVSAMVAAFRRWLDPPGDTVGFTPFERAEFPITQVLPSARLADLYATSTDVASLPEDLRTGLLAHVRKLSARLPTLVELQRRSVVDLCFREPDPDD